MKKTCLLLSVITTLLTACTQSPDQVSQQEANEIILNIHKIYEKAVPEKDLSVIMTLYEEDATYLPFQHVILKGKDEISKAWERTFTYPVVSFDLEVVSVSVHGDLIHEIGRTHSIFDFNGEKIPGEFKYLNVWRRQPNGEYKIHMATYNAWLDPADEG
ncbi:MAG: DUF4440 domain-containing protein [Roseivirga sp.]|nr:DUF4440 domain-containing protein [Roseivirga sp.]